MAVCDRVFAASLLINKSLSNEFSPLILHLEAFHLNGDKEASASIGLRPATGNGGVPTIFASCSSGDENPYLGTGPVDHLQFLCPVQGFKFW